MIDAKAISDIIASAGRWARIVIPAVDGIANLAEADRVFIDVLVSHGVLTQEELDDLELGE